MSNYPEQKKTFFTLITFTAGINFILWLVLTYKILPAADSWLLLIIRTHEPLAGLSAQQYLLFALAAFWFVSTAFLIYALVCLLNSVIKTVVYLRKLKTYDYHGIKVVRSEKMLAFTSGIFTINTFLSRRLLRQLPEAELKAVILHEQYHKQNKDPLSKIFIDFCLNSVLYIPVASVMKKFYLLLCELSADYYTQQNLQSGIPLLKALSIVLSAEQAPIALNNFAYNSRRIEILTGEKKLLTHKTILVSVTFILIMSGFVILLLNLDLAKLCQIPYYF
jgi:Zn-dependent protease with chaperone function